MYFKKSKHSSSSYFILTAMDHQVAIDDGSNSEQSSGPEKRVAAQATEPRLEGDRHETHTSGDGESNGDGHGDEDDDDWLLSDDEIPAGGGRDHGGREEHSSRGEGCEDGHGKLRGAGPSATIAQREWTKMSDQFQDVSLVLLAPEQREQKMLEWLRCGLGLFERRKGHGFIKDRGLWHTCWAGSGSVERCSPHVCWLRISKGFQRKNHHIIHRPF